MDKSKFVIGIQARINSTRFPRKCFAKWNGDDMWYHVYKTAVSTGIESVMLVPGTDSELINDMRDRPVCVKYLTGPENSPLERYRILQMNYPGRFIIRITADCPLLTREIILDMANKMYYGASGKATLIAGIDSDFLYNELDGMDVQICFPWILTDKEEKYVDHEHVFNMDALKNAGLYSKWEMHMSIDTPEQYHYLINI